MNENFNILSPLCFLIFIVGQKVELKKKKRTKLVKGEKKEGKRKK